MCIRESRLCIPLALTIAFLFVLGGCDILGDSDDAPDDSKSEAVKLWNGTYEGTGREVDYSGGLPDVSDIQPRLSVGLRDTLSLDSLRLSWNQGNNFVQASGRLKTFTRDTLVTTLQEVVTDSYTTEFQFQLGRDSITASSDSVRIRGTIRQFFENTNSEIDSTVIVFTVFAGD